MSLFRETAEVRRVAHPIPRTSELWFKHDSEKKQMAEIQAILRRVFCETLDGQIALAVILDDHAYGRPCETPEDVTLRNWAGTFLQTRLGITNDTLATIVAIINSQVHKES